MSFAKEEDMQAWLRGRMKDAEGLAEIIINPEVSEPNDSDDSQTRAVRADFAYCLQFLNITEVITDNEDISLKDGEILRPDFVLYSVEHEAIVVVELKNIVSPSRQAGTEAGAYAGELRSHLPFLSDGDVINVLISSVWPTLLRHYVAHEMIWTGRHIICLEPKEIGTAHELSIVDPSRFSDEIDLKISSYEMGGYQLCLYDNELYRGGARTRLDPYTSQMRTVLHMMAARGNALRSHGFAFLWKDTWSLSLAPYSITLVQAAPFQGVAKFLLNLEEGTEPVLMQERLLKLAKDYEPCGHSQALAEVLRIAQISLGSICSPAPEGFTHWKDLRTIMRGRSELISFIGWGRFGETYAECMMREFQNGNLSIASDDVDVGLYVLAELLTEERPILPGDVAYASDETDHNNE